MQKSPRVNTLILNNPFTVAGKLFKGDYSKSKEYIDQVKSELENGGVLYEQFKVLGVYYDNPHEKKAHELRSFQGAFLCDPRAEIPDSLEKLSLEGNFLHGKLCVEQMKSIYE